MSASETAAGLVLALQPLARTCDSRGLRGNAWDDLEESGYGGGVDSAGGGIGVVRLDPGGSTGDGGGCRACAAGVLCVGGSHWLAGASRLDDFLRAGAAVFGLAAECSSGGGLWRDKRAGGIIVVGLSHPSAAGGGVFPFCFGHGDDCDVYTTAFGGDAAGGGDQCKRAAARGVSVDLCGAATWLERIRTLAADVCAGDYLGRR